MEKQLVLNNRWLGLREDLNFWRSLGLASSALALFLIVLLLVRQPEQAATTANFVATLSDDSSQPIAVISGDIGRHRLNVNLLMRPVITPDKSMELWVVPKIGNLRSLGLIADNGILTLRLPDNATPESVAWLAVSLEPQGGSPNPNGPTGPILFKGAWVPI
jgi:anti-sigma-K factor RskA